MKYILCVILYYICLLMISINAQAETVDSYIVKYKNEDTVQIITSEEKECLYGTDSLFPAEENELIEYIEPNYQAYLYDTAENKDWNVDMINATNLSEYGCYGNDIKIAILDSGIVNYEGIADNVIQGFSVIDSSDNIVDNIGHGTFVSGIIANDAGNEYAVGISQKVKIIPIKCFDKNYTTKVDKIAEAIDYAVNVCNCNVINMSFGINGNSAYLKNKIDMALQNNVIIVSAVGNNGSDSLRYPAAYDGVVGVGAVDEDCVWCDFSQHNNSVDIVAPGKNLYGISINGYSESSGTSFSTPHIAAAAAIALSIDNEITPQQFINILIQTSTDLGEEGYDEYYGYGLLNVGNLIEQLIKRNLYFVSPISCDGEKATIVVCNNTQDNMQAKLILTDFEEQVLLNATILDLNLKPLEKRKIDYTFKSSGLKCFLWDDFSHLSPLYNTRQINL